MHTHGHIHRESERDLDKINEKSSPIIICIFLISHSKVKLLQIKIYLYKTQTRTIYTALLIFFFSGNMGRDCFKGNKIITIIIFVPFCYLYIYLGNKKERKKYMIPREHQQWNTWYQENQIFCIRISGVLLYRANMHICYWGNHFL